MFVPEVVLILDSKKQSDKESNGPYEKSDSQNYPHALVKQ